MKIHSERQYKKGKIQLESLEKQRETIRNNLKIDNCTDTEIEIALMGINKIYHTLQYDLESYEKAVNGYFDKESTTMNQLGTYLIKMRIYKGITQEELAQRLGISQAQISKDERNEYLGIGTSKLTRILQVLGVEKLTIIPKDDFPSQYHDWMEKQKDLQERETSSSKQAG